MKKFLLVAGAVLALATPALAQVPSYAPPPLQRPTFMANFTGLAVPQTGAMDAACITGSSTRKVIVQRVNINGVKTTAQSAVLNLVKRTAANTGGTSTTATAVPTDTTTNSLTASAVVRGYTVAPTPGAGTNVSAAVVGFGPSTSQTTDRFVREWNAQQLIQPLALSGAAQQLCVNFPNAFTTDGVSLNISFEWTEQ